VTNLPPIVNPPVDPKPGACKCDLSRSLVDDPERIYNAVHGPDALKNAGNNEGCPVQAKDTRCRIVGKPIGRTPKIASWCKGNYGYRDGQVTCQCFTREIGGRRYAFHYIGWSRSEAKPAATDNPFPYKGTSFAFWEMREAQP